MHSFTKKAMISALMAIIIVFTGCSSYPHLSWLEDDSLEKIAEKRCEDIISALENEDAEAIKSMFSKQALEESEDLDENIEYVIEYYQGNMISSDGITPSEENINGKEKKVTIKGDFTIITDKETYNLFFIEKSNTENKDENGLYMFRLIKESEKEILRGILEAGIYVPKE